VSYVACGGDDATPHTSDAGGTGGGGINLVPDAGVAGSAAADVIVEQALPGFDDVVANLMR